MLGVERIALPLPVDADQGQRAAGVELDHNVDRMSTPTLKNWQLCTGRQLGAASSAASAVARSRSPRSPACHAAPSAAVDHDVGCSQRNLVARFREQVGLAPKALARVLRFQASLQLLEHGGRSLADMTALAGYDDQADCTASSAPRRLHTEFPCWPPPVAEVSFVERLGPSSARWFVSSP